MPGLVKHTEGGGWLEVGNLSLTWGQPVSQASASSHSCGEVWSPSAKNGQTLATAQRSHPPVPEIVGAHVGPRPFFVPSPTHKPQCLRADSPLAGLLGDFVLTQWDVGDPSSSPGPTSRTFVYSTKFFFVVEVLEIEPGPRTC